MPNTLNTCRHNTESESMINKIQTDSSKAMKELGQLSVPTPAVQIHEYLLTFFQLLAGSHKHAIARAD
jgi:hypothetical protein